MALVTVMNRTTPIFEVELDESGRLLDIGNVLDEKLMPVCLQGSGSFSRDTVSKWMTDRLIPDKKRIGYEDVRRAFQVTSNRHNMFSLSDQYWFRWSQRETWGHGNFFTNPYETDWGRMFFSPWTVNPDNLRKESPDMTTNGVLKKRWVRNDDTGVSVLIKAGSREAHQDPLCEVLSSMTLAQLSIIPFVQYELCVDGLTFCCRCENFVTAKTEFVPAGHVYHRERRNKETDTPYRHLVKMTKKYAPGIQDPEYYYQRMMVADACTGNTDRNLSNFGFIRSAETGEIIDFAPLFDMGSALFDEGGTKKARLFSEEDTGEAIKQISKNFGQRIVKQLKERDLLDVVDTYPMLMESEKKKIAKKIGDNYNKIRKTIGDMISYKRIDPNTTPQIEIEYETVH